MPELRRRWAERPGSPVVQGLPENGRRGQSMVLCGWGVPEVGTPQEKQSEGLRGH